MEKKVFVSTKVLLEKSFKKTFKKIKKIKIIKTFIIFVGLQKRTRKLVFFRTTSIQRVIKMILLPRKKDFNVNYLTNYMFPRTF